METKLSKSAQKVQDILTHYKIPFKVIELPTSTRTAQEAALAIGCTIAQIVKSLIFKTTQTNQPILILASGSNKVQEALIAQIIGEPITKADADFTREVTGFAIGGIPPIGHIHPIRTFIDKDLLNYEELWAAAGTPHAVFQLTSESLINLTNGTIISIH